jgi:two-component system LytT family response regulator
MIRALLVDDEAHSRASVRALVEGQPHWQIVGECEDAAGLQQALAQYSADVVFLDIRLPGADGISLARVLQKLNPSPLVVFTTAFEGYAVDAFEVQAVDYVLKPFDDSRFLTAMRRVEQALGAKSRSRGDYLQRVVIRSIGRVQFVDVADIQWLEASGNYVEIHAGKELFLHRARLHNLDAQLDPSNFVRIHRSVIVNRTVVDEVRPLSGGDFTVVIRGGGRLRMSRTYRAALDSFIGGKTAVMVAASRD